MLLVLSCSAAGGHYAIAHGWRPAGLAAGRLRERGRRGRPRVPARQRRQPPTSTSPKRWVRRRVRSTPTATAGWTSSWSTAVRWPSPRWRARARHRLFRNRGNGTFEDVTASAGIRQHRLRHGRLRGDYDNDGRIDLYLTQLGPNALYHNNGDGTFSDVTRAAGVGADRLEPSCAFADVDGDGDLDLFVTTYVDATRAATASAATRSPVRAYCHPLTSTALPNVLYRNNGDGTFTDVSAAAGVGAHARQRAGRGRRRLRRRRLARPVRRQRRDAELLLPQRGRRPVPRDGACRRASPWRPTARRAPAWAPTSADYDGDGRLDLVVTNLEFETHSLFRNLGGGLFADATLESGIGLADAAVRRLRRGVPRLSTTTADLDLAIANGHVLDNTRAVPPGVRATRSASCCSATTAGRVQGRSAAAGPGFALEKVGRALAAGDIDNDGDLDLLVTNNGQTRRPAAERRRHRGGALLVRLVGTPEQPRRRSGRAYARPSADARRCGR